MSLDSQLHEFSKSLAPTAQQKTAFQSVVNDLNRSLGCQLRPDRILAAGSFEKGTGLKFNMDLDVICFVNDKYPRFRDLNKEIEKIVRNQIPGIVAISSNSFLTDVKLKRDGVDIHLEILPATNFAKGERSINEQTAARQYQRAIEHMKTVPRRERTIYSTCLTETAVRFVKSQSSSIHNLIRLAKFWLYANLVEKKSGGYSSAIEAIAIYAGQELEKQPGRPFSIKDAFENFLGYVSNMDSNIRIVFDEEFMNNKTYPAYYKRSDIPEDVRTQSPLLLDPADSYNNRLDSLDRDICRDLAGKARNTLSKIRSGHALRAIMAPVPNGQYRCDVDKALNDFVLR